MNYASSEAGFRDSTPWFYFVLPFFVLIACVDYFLLSGILIEALPRHPKELFLYSYLLVFPHIFMSSVLYFDKECVEEFRKPLFVIVPVVIAYLIASKTLLPEAAVISIFASVTGYHLITQQYGIYKLFNGQTHPLFYYAKWSTILIVLVVSNLIAFNPGTYNFSNEVKYMLWAMALVACVFTLLTMRKTDDWKGQVIILGNFLTVGLYLFLLESQFRFFSILVTRCLHDFTAITIYVYFSENRNKKQNHNLVTKLIHWSFFSPGAKVLLASFVLSTVFQLFKFSLVLEFMVWVHYATEAISWKGDSVFKRSLFS